MTQEFKAEIYKLGINPCVDVPQRVSQGFGIRGYVPVAGTLNGVPIRATLVPKGGGRHRMYINTDMRKRTGVDVGDQIELVLELDELPRIESMPQALALELEAHPQASKAFEALTPSRQKEILVYLNSLKRPESLQRNIDKLLANLLKDDSD